VGIIACKRVHPLEADISSTWPLRLATACIHPPRHSSGTSKYKVSYGSCIRPSISLRMTDGRLTKTSNPSRLIVSTSTATCMAPRALTLNSVESFPSSTLIDTLVRASRNKRSRISREVTRSPSRPAKGPSFTEKDIITVGGSICTKGKPSASGLPESVSPISTSSKPATPTIFPATPSDKS